MKNFGHGYKFVKIIKHQHALQDNLVLFEIRNKVEQEMSWGILKTHKETNNKKNNSCLCNSLWFSKDCKTLDIHDNPLG